MRAVVLLIALSACQHAEPVVPKEAPFNAVHHAMARSVFLKSSGCSAIQVSEVQIATAKHCLPDDAEFGDIFEDGAITYISTDRDFAVFTRFEAAPLYAQMRPAVVGEHIYVIGWPVQLGSGKQALTVTDGVVAGPIDDEGQMRITAPVYFGNSGGGVWGDDGMLIGIAVSIYAASIEGYSRPMPYAAQSFMVQIEDVIAAL